MHNFSFLLASKDLEKFLAQKICCMEHLKSISDKNLKRIKEGNDSTETSKCFSCQTTYQWDVEVAVAVRLSSVLSTLEETKC